jgi:hypothetical protein
MPDDGSSIPGRYDLPETWGASARQRGVMDPRAHALGFGVRPRRAIEPVRWEPSVHHHFNPIDKRAPTMSNRIRGILRRSPWLLAATAAIGVGAASGGCSQNSGDHAESSSQAIVPANPSWNGWGSLNGGLTTDPALVSFSKNYIGAFATNEDLWFNWFPLLSWQGWVSLGNNGNALTSPPVAVVVGNHIEVFVLDTVSGFLLHKEGTTNGVSAPTWSAWENIWLLENAGSGVAATGPLANLSRPPAVVVTQPNNQVNIIANFADGSTKAIKGSGALGDWSFWTNLGGASGYEPGAVSWGTDRIDVFVVGTNAQVYHQYSNDEGTTFNPPGWELVGGNAASAPSVVSWGANRLDVFVSGRPSGQISGVEHLAWTGSSWGTCGAPPCWDSLHMLAWQNGLDGAMSPPVAVTTGVGAINVFAQTIDQGLMTMAMTSANPPTWGNQSELTGCFRTLGTPAVISPDGYTLDVAVTGWAANGDASVYANSTSDGTEFTAAGITPPPVCACGFPGGTCCWPENGCNDGAVCGATTICACDSAHVQQTVNGQAVCTPCGVLGEIVCSGNVCTPGSNSVPFNGKCVTPGILGNPCNTDGTCDPGNIYCDSGTCQPTGGEGVPCNANGTCNAGALLCLVSPHICAACGANEQWCCSGQGGSSADGSSNEACGAGLSCDKTDDLCQTPAEMGGGSGGSGSGGGGSGGGGSGGGGSGLCGDGTNGHSFTVCCGEESLTYDVCTLAEALTEGGDVTGLYCQEGACPN